MSELRKPSPSEMEASSQRSKLIGGAVIVVGLCALGAYSFASNDEARPAPIHIVSTQVRTTPEYAETMPAPVSPTPLAQKAGTPARAKAHDDDESQTALQTQPSPAPLQTPPENAPGQNAQSSGVQDDETQDPPPAPDGGQTQPN